MVTERVAQEQPEGSDEDNPIVAEMHQMNAEGDDADILREIDELNKAEQGEETPPVQPVPVTVQETPAVPVVPAAQPQVPLRPRQPSAEDVLRQRLQQLEFERAEAQREKQEAQLQSQTQAYRQQLEQEGWQPEHARTMSERELAFRRRETEIARNAELYVLNLQGKQNAAQHFGKQYGIPSEQLLIYNTPEQMAAAARMHSEMQRQGREIDQMKKQRVPRQSYEAGTASGQAPSSRESVLDRYIAGDRSPEVLAVVAKL